jgi:hypothetical protein
MPAQTASINTFKGLAERLQIGESLQFTTSLDNVIVRNGNVLGRKGIALWDGISTAATNIIIGLAEFYAPANATSQLLRMQTTKLEVWNDGTNAWDDVTGTALTGTTSTRPCFATMSDEGFLVFTNEGHDRPRKYTGSGNSATLGGTPPYAKWLEPYKGFLFLFNTSTDGTFGATADSITAVFSDVPDGDWSPCESNTIIFDESPGELRAALTYGPNMIVYKSDCLVLVRFIGGEVKFTRQKVNFNLGILAPLSLQGIGEFGQIFLATDRNLYRTDGNSVVPLPNNIQKSLQETMSPSVAANCRGYVDLSHETYHLLYQRSGTTYFDGRLSYNYRTGEFYRGAYTGYEFTAALGYRQTNNLAAQLVVAASDKKVYEQESGTDDAGTKVTRYYDIDWNQYGSPGSKYLTGANLVFTHSTNTQVRISIATDHSHIFQYARMFSLKGKFPSDTNVRVKYELPSPVYGSWFKVRIEFFHYGSSSVVELQEIEPIIIPVAPVPMDQAKQPQAQRA